MDAVSYAAAFVFPIAAVVGHYLGGGWNFLTPLVAFVLVPILDHLIGLDTRNPDDEARMADRVGYRLITWAAAPAQVALTVWAAWAFTRAGLSTTERAGLLISVGICNGGVGIVVAHELVHRLNSKVEPLLGGVILSTVCYMHWALEHVAGHHRMVSTPEDPSSSRRGESFYAFWPRTVFGTIRSAAQLHATRQQRKGRSTLDPRNGMLWAALVPAGWAAGLGFAFGPLAAGFFLAQAVVAFSLLELVNYVEHYGLARAEISPGKYERVTPLHSWNASHWLTNRLLFMLQRHSDHHANPRLRYQELRHFDDRPQLPAGYATMILLALVPPLWRKVMAPRIPTSPQ